MGIYRSLWKFMVIYECLWDSMGFLGVYGYLWVSMGLYTCLWMSMSSYMFLDVYGYLWVSMEVYGFPGVYGHLWVARVSMGIGIYLNIKNIPYFLIQEPQKIWKLQKTAEIKHVL